MTDWKKIGLIGGISTASLTGLFFLFRGAMNKAHDLGALKKLSDQLQTIPRAMIHKIDFSGLTIRIDVKLKNPTQNAFKMQYPFVNVLYGTEPIGSSQAVNKVLSIGPYGEANIEAIMLNFPILSMLTLVGGLFKSLQTGAAVKLNVLTTSTVDPLWKVVNGKWIKIDDYGFKAVRSIAYNQSKPVTIKKAAGG